MQNEQTLIDLGFYRYPDWDYAGIGVMHYRLDKEGLTFRAYVNHNNGTIPYVSLGLVVNEKGQHKGMRDCVSNGSVERKILAYIETNNKKCTFQNPAKDYGHFNSADTTYTRLDSPLNYSKMDNKIKHELKVKKIREMKNPTIFISKEDRDWLAEKLMSKEVVRGNENNPTNTYYGIPIITSNTMQKGDILVIDTYDRI